jgi:hypothetical protein
MRKHCYHAHNVPAYQCHDPITFTLKRMIDQDVMLAAHVDNNGSHEEVIVRGNYQHCYYRDCQHKAQNGVGMLGHMQQSHHKHNPADMGLWDILIDHLAQNHDATIGDLIGHKEAFICKHKGRGYVAISEKAMITHNTQQHRAEAQWARAELGVHLGVAAPSETDVDPAKEYDTLHTKFFAKKEMSVDEANILGKEFLAKALNDWQNGV